MTPCIGHLSGRLMLVAGGPGVRPLLDQEAEQWGVAFAGSVHEWLWRE